MSASVEFSHLRAHGEHEQVGDSIQGGDEMQAATRVPSASTAPLLGSRYGPGHERRNLHVSFHSSTMDPKPFWTKFSLRGELVHAFFASVEGDVFAQLLAARIRALSLDTSEDGTLKIPRHGWGLSLKAAKRPQPFRPDEAKVQGYL